MTTALLLVEPTVRVARVQALRSFRLNAFSAPVAPSDLCQCGWEAARHKLLGGVIAHPYVHVAHVDD